MDFNDTHWDVLELIMKFKDKSEYLDKIEKRAKSNFSYVLKEINDISSFNFNEVDGDTLYYAETTEYKLDKSKRFFWSKSGRKMKEPDIRENEDFICLMIELFESYEMGAEIYPLAYPEDRFEQVDGRMYPNGLDLEAFTDYFIQDNDIHHEIELGRSGYYYAEWRFKNELGLNNLMYAKMTKNTEDYKNNHKEAFYECLDEIVKS